MNETGHFRLLEIPYDILSIIVDFLPTSSLLSLRSTSRALDDSLAPKALHKVHLSFTYPNAYYSLAGSGNSSSTLLFGLHKHTRHLAMTISDHYISDYLTMALVPGLWTNLSLLRNLEAFELGWELRQDTDNDRPGGASLKNLDDWLQRISAIVVEATTTINGKGALKSLILRPAPSYPRDLIPEPLLELSRLERITIIRGRLEEGCPAVPWIDLEIGGLELVDCHCVPERDISLMCSLVRTNSQTLQDLTIRFGCTRWELKSEMILPHLHALRRLDIPGFKIESRPTGSDPQMVPPIDVSPLTNLQSLYVHYTFNTFNLDPLWIALKSAGIALTSFHCNQITFTLADYLASFSRLQEMYIHNIENTFESNSIRTISKFFDHALAAHAPTLIVLSIRFVSNFVPPPRNGTTSRSENQNYLDEWRYNPHRWNPIFSQFTSLKRLHLPPPSFPGFRSIKFGEFVQTNYQNIIEAVQHIPTLCTLEIVGNGPSRTGRRHSASGFTMKRMIEKQIREAIALLVVPPVRSRDRQRVPEQLVVMKEVYLLGENGRYVRAM